MNASKLKTRYIIKLGTRVLTKIDGSLDEYRIKEVLSSIRKQRSKDIEFVLVSSGAVGLGRKALGMEKNISLAEKQACAAVGQVSLMETYKRLGTEFDIPVAQILLTHH